MEKNQNQQDFFWGLPKFDHVNQELWLLLWTQLQPRGGVINPGLNTGWVDLGWVDAFICHTLWFSNMASSKLQSKFVFEWEIPMEIHLWMADFPFLRLVFHERVISPNSWNSKSGTGMIKQSRIAGVCIFTGTCRGVQCKRSACQVRINGWKLVSYIVNGKYTSIRWKYCFLFFNECKYVRMQACTQCMYGRTGQWMVINLGIRSPQF